MALKRQQAAEDAIALHLASAETGKPLDHLPPGRIFGMQVTSPEPEKTKKEEEEEEAAAAGEEERRQEVEVSPASVDMLSKLFPSKKRSVLELVLRRCNHDLLKAIEHFNVARQERRAAGEEEGASAFRPVGAKAAGGARPSPPQNPLLGQNKILMHGIYPFLPILNHHQPILSAPLYVPGRCDCEDCRYGLYARVDSIL